MKSFFTTIIITFLFTSCASKVQNDVIDSNKEDISELLNTLIKKEKEINDLNKRLEECRNSKSN